MAVNSGDCADERSEDKSGHDDISDKPHCCNCLPQSLFQMGHPSKGLHVDIHRGLFASSVNQSQIDWYDRILTNVRWHRVKYKSKRFQKDCETPCYTSFYGGREEYSPYFSVPSWFQPLIDAVTSHLSDIGNVQFNAFLLRLYFDGKDEIAWHTDGRTFFGEKPIIASLSFGSRATFQMRRMLNVWPCVDGFKRSDEKCSGVDTSTPTQSFVVNDGDLLVMRGATQKHWHHRVPKEKGRGVRLNVNFRYVMPGMDAERGQRTYYKYMVYGDCPMDKEPPSWSFNEIMEKKGGIRNFLQRFSSEESRNEFREVNKKLIDDDEFKGPNFSGRTSLKGAEHEEKVKNNSKFEQTNSMIKSDNKSNYDQIAKQNQYTSTSLNHEIYDVGNKSDSIPVEIRQFLKNNPTVDPTIFMELPNEVQSELIRQSLRQLSDSIPSSPAINKRRMSSPNRYEMKKSRTTLESFFKKK